MPEKLSNWYEIFSDFKESIHQNLKDGIDVSSKDKFEKWKKLLTEMWGLNLKQVEYDTLKSELNEKIILQQVGTDNHLTVFTSIKPFIISNPGLPMSKFWEIRDWVFTKKIDKNINYPESKKEDRGNPYSLKYEEIKKQSKSERRNILPDNERSIEKAKWWKIETPPITTFEEYTIQKWDTLWNIVKTKYNLSDPRDIANTINALAKYNADKLKKTNLLSDTTIPPDWIIWDKIYYGRKIHIPDEIPVLWKKIEKKK